MPTPLEILDALPVAIFEAHLAGDRRLCRAIARLAVDRQWLGVVVATLEGESACGLEECDSGPNKGMPGPCPDGAGEGGSKTSKADGKDKGKKLSKTDAKMAAMKQKAADIKAKLAAAIGGGIAPQASPTASAPATASPTAAKSQTVPPGPIKDRIGAAKHLQERVATLRDLPDPQEKAKEWLAGEAVAYRKQHRDNPEMMAKESDHLRAKYQERLAMERQGVADQINKALQVEGAAKMPMTVTGGASEGFIGKTQQAHSFYKGMVAADELPDLRMTESVGKRARYLPESHEVIASDAKTASVFVHEIAHGLEEKVPGIKEACQEFVEYRCGNEPVRKMSDINPDVGYGDFEKGRKDDFAKALGSERRAFYAGKVYESGNTEILSMGAELLHDDPKGFAQRDPEWCAFVLGMLDGSLRKGK